MKIPLIELKNHKELIGKQINVTRKGGQYHYDYQDKPMLRVFRGVDTHTETHKGKKEIWLRWNWTPKIEEKGLREDCGYSEMRINDNPDFDLSYLEI